MYLQLDELNENYDNEIFMPTGVWNVEQYQFIKYPFGNFIVEIKVTLDGKFVEIVGLKINRDFIDYQKLSPKFNYHDVEDYYDKDF